ncbi:MAG: DUF1844 domain-containing protein [Candidatus Marinimicrobia bacterium]|nr:DUF1844 domain-containing protein [Candidatus Neomarinimicrobiota bacterium]
MSEKSDKFDPLFINLVLTLHNAAMLQMGKLKNPASDKIERDMSQAEMSIDMLDMLKNKSEGNLTDEEKSILSRTLNELKMNFMDEKAKDEKSDSEEKTEEKSEEEPDKEETEKEESATGEDETDEIKEGKKE